MLTIGPRRCCNRPSLLLVLCTEMEHDKQSVVHIKRSWRRRRRGGGVRDTRGVTEVQGLRACEPKQHPLRQKYYRKPSQAKSPLCPACLSLPARKLRVLDVESAELASMSCVPKNCSIIPFFPSKKKKKKTPDETVRYDGFGRRTSEGELLSSRGSVEGPFSPGRRLGETSLG